VSAIAQPGPCLRPAAASNPSDAPCPAGTAAHVQRKGPAVPLLHARPSLPSVRSQGCQSPARSAGAAAFRSPPIAQRAAILNRHESQNKLKALCVCCRWTCLRSGSTAQPAGRDVIPPPFEALFTMSKTDPSGRMMNAGPQAMRGILQEQRVKCNSEMEVKPRPCATVSCARRRYPTHAGGHVPSGRPRLRRLEKGV